MVDTEHFEDWVGRERITHEVVSLTQARALAATLDRDPGTLHEGDDLPHGWHWIYFNPAVPRSEMGPDGHEKRGAFLPAMPGARRMWAGGELSFVGRLRIGSEYRRVSTIRSIEPKEGRSGPLVFVEVGHTILADGEVVLDEVQRLVYRLGDPNRGEARPTLERQARTRPTIAAPNAAPVDWSEPYSTDELTLFRFSALTFNGHRIHYDHRYATQVEGYPGLVVHGPLLALLLLDAGVRRIATANGGGGGGGGGSPTRFRYRALGPLFCGEEFELGGTELSGSAQPDASPPVPGTRAMQLWATHPERGIATEAELDVVAATDCAADD